MIIEHALLTVKPGEVDEFMASVTEALAIIESADGCSGAEVRQQVEDSATFLLLVRWTSVEAHYAFRASELFEPWRARTQPFYAEPASVTHFNEPLRR